MGPEAVLAAGAGNDAMLREPIIQDGGRVCRILDTPVGTRGPICTYRLAYDGLS